MLNDRNYMGNPVKNARNRERSGMQCIFILIAINVLFYIVSMVGDHNPIYESMTLTITGIKHWKLWMLVSYMFLHGGFLHIFMNMYALYLFGSTAVPSLGAKRLLALYFTGGIIGAVAWVAANWNSEYIVQNGIPYQNGMVGASAGVAGIIIAAAMMFPDKQFQLLLPPVPIKLKTLAIVFILIDVVGQFVTSGMHIAHLAHLGGVLGAYVYMKFFYKGVILWDPLPFIGGNAAGIRKRPAGWTVIDKEKAKADPDGAISSKELDRLLDKISASGINSLTPEEMATLKRARNQMKRD